MTESTNRAGADSVTSHDDAPVTSSKTAKPERALLAEAVTVMAPASEIYAFWRDVTRLQTVMDNVLSIEAIDDKRSRWTVKAPGGRTVSWEAIITEDRPGESISWQSAEGADIDNSGRVEFRSAGARGTIVRATIAYNPPAGAIGQIIAKLFQREPRIQARRDLHRLKQVFEAGEVATGARNRRLHQERSKD
ncbi:MAG: SRPBCC family protein [Pseudomonadota bacterium]